MSNRSSATITTKEKLSVMPMRSSLLQRKCACGNSSGLTGSCDNCQKKNLQRRSANQTEISEVPPIVHEVLRSPGRSLDSDTREFMESRIGHDFSQVRIHTDDRAAKSAKSLNALAYIAGSDVVFGATQYAPQTSSGKRLIAHELAHTIQQQHTQAVNIQRQPEISKPDDRLEQEAEQITVAAVPKPTKKPTKKNQAAQNPCTKTILAEGTCKFLVLNAAGRCCAPDNGIENPRRSTDVEGKSCPSHKFTPMFTCDNNCETALEKGCDDNDHWMAIPGNQFRRSKCGDTFIICANGLQTHGYVRDKSVTRNHFEVSPGIQIALGVAVGTSFLGAVYQSNAAQNIVDRDKCCNKPSPQTYEDFSQQDEVLV
jgi:hypothetical protein